MKLNDIIYGFKLVRIKPVKEINGEIYTFEHMFSGAELIWTKREDENKTFAITFRTTPTDDTGVFHILEHSVLCGSKKYPVKDPFVRMLQSSMQTFLNAMTYPDKTVYPISSRNNKDFMNLMDVYLDAVFAPAFLEKPYAFLQEGRHFEDDENGVSVQGVVFSEMQGVYQDVNERIDTAVGTELFPDTCYSHNSGGYPLAIPELTYEKFIDTYKKYYSASNSIIHLDGSVDIMSVLKYIDGEYLCKMKNEGNIVTIEKQEKTEPHTAVYYYDEEPEEIEKGRDYLVLAKITGDYSELKKTYAVDLICDCLCSSNEAPLKRAVLDSGLADDIRISVMDEIAQSFVTITADNCKRENFVELRKIIMESISETIKIGFDREELAAHLNQLVFDLSESARHYGLETITTMLKSELYDGKPELYLEYEAVTDELRRNIETDYYEKLAEEVFCDADFTEIDMLAKAGFNDEEQTLLDEKVKSIISGMSEEELAKQREQTEGMYRWQEEPDSTEALATLPVLKISEVDKKLITPVATEHYAENIRILTVPTESRISYFRFYFELSDSVTDKLFELSLMSNLFLSLPTEKYSVKELQRQINLYLGSISFDILPVKGKDNNICKAYLIVVCSALKENTDKVFELVREVILTTKFDNASKIKENIIQLRNMMKDNIPARGNTYGIGRALSGITATAGIVEQTTGYEFYKNLKELTDKFDEKFTSLKNNIEYVCKDIFNRSRLTVGVSDRVDDESIIAFADSLPCGDFYRPELRTRLDINRSEGIRIAGNVSYAVLADNIGDKYGAASLTVSHYLSYDCLWNEIRVQNGAYGAGLFTRSNGDAAFYSYRDPNPDNSIKVYKNAAEKLAGAEFGEEEFESVKIGTVCGIEPLMAASQKIKIGCDDFISGNTYERKQSVKDGILALTPDEIKAFASVLDEMKNNGNIFVVGDEKALSDCGVSVINNL